MKKRIVLIGLLLFCSFCTVAGETTEIQFRIQADSALHEEAELKRQMMEVYAELAEGADSESRAVLVAQSLDHFQFEENLSVSYHENTLILIQGDGKGSLIHGSFDQVQCGRPVHRKSWIAQMLKR